MKIPTRYLLIALTCIFIAACGGNQPTAAPAAPTDTTVEEVQVSDGADEEHGHDHAVDPSLFLTEGLVSDITEEPCVLSGGTATTCYRFSVSSTPVEYVPGPWCPTNIVDSAEAGGIWPENGEINDVDGAFIENLAVFYNDETWRLYNDDGTINYTDSLEACELAARPNVDPAYQNYCVQCLPSYVVGDGDGALVTYVIPMTPVEAATPTQIGNTAIGMAFNGVKFDAPAPTAAILGAYTIAPFDDCGGHVNPASGYHYHMHTGCTTEVAQEDDHAPMIGYALDGYPLYARLNANGEEPTDLDESRGHDDEVRGYHYHVADGGTNSFINSFHGESGCTFNGNGEGDTCDASANTGRGGPGARGEGRPPDFAAAAEKLGITEDALIGALGDPPPDFEVAAETLGIPVEALQDALDDAP